MVLVVPEVADHALRLVLAARILEPALELGIGDALALCVAVQLGLQPIVDEDHLDLPLSKPVLEQSPLPRDVEV
jgi:hypothetical protein